MSYWTISDPKPRLPPVITHVGSAKSLIEIHEPLVLYFLSICMYPASKRVYVKNTAYNRRELI